jgi:hypothetical protein
LGLFLWSCCPGYGQSCGQSRSQSRNDVQTNEQRRRNQNCEEGWTTYLGDELSKRISRFTISRFDHGHTCEGARGYYRFVFESIDADASRADIQLNTRQRNLLDQELKARVLARFRNAMFVL